MFSCNNCDFTAVHVTMLTNRHKKFNSSPRNLSQIVKVQYVNMLDELTRIIGGEGGVHFR